MHTFNADAYERLKVWIENPDPEKYHLAYEESQGILGTWTKRDAAGWNVVLNNVINWVISVQQKPQVYMFAPESQWRESTADSTNFNLYGTFSGRLWLDYHHAWGGTAYPQYNPALGNDIAQPGITMVGSYLTRAGVAAMEAWKKDNRDFSQAEYEAFTAATLKAHPEYIAETVTSVTDANGEYHIQFYGLDKATGLAATSPWNIGNTLQREINTNYIYIAPLLPDSMNYISPFQNPVFQSSFEPARANNNTIGAGASQLDFALYFGNPVFDVVDYNTTTNPAPAGATVQTNTSGVVPGYSYSIVWRDEAGTEVGRCTGLVADAAGKLPSCPFVVPDLPQAKIYTAELLDPLGQVESADSFATTLHKIDAPYGSVGDAYLGDYSETPPLGATASNYTAVGLPAGLTIDPNTGVISGVPWQAGTTEVSFSSTITFANGTTQTVTRTASITITDTPLIDGMEGQLYFHLVEPQGLPAGAQVSDLQVGGLPEGLFFDGTMIVGKPEEPGVYPEMVQVSYTVTTAEGVVHQVVDTVDLIIHPDPDKPFIDSITNLTVPEDQPIVAIPVNYGPSWVEPTVTGLPEGLSYANGQIMGTPKDPGVYPITITVDTGLGHEPVSTTFVLTVTDETAPVITADNRQVDAGKPLVPITITTDDPTAQLSVSGLPTGLKFDPATGVISGTTERLGSHTVQVTAVDPAGNVSTKQIVITVNDATAPTITVGATSVTVDEKVAFPPFPITTDDPTATLTVPTAQLPDGLRFENGQIVGTPTKPGVYPVTITATDPAGNSSSVTVTITVLDKTPPVVTAPPVVFDEDKPITPLAPSIDDPTAIWTVTGLPKGLDFADGWVTGTPTEPGVYPVTITATDPAGNSTTVNTTITIVDKTAPVITAASARVDELAPITPIKVGVDDATATVTVAGLPDGLSYDPATGEITGTLGKVGLGDKVYPVTITATDPAGNTTTKKIEITVVDRTPPEITAFNWTFDEDINIEDQAGRPLRLISDDPTASYAVTGLPPGLSISYLSEARDDGDGYVRGLVTGPATEPGVYEVTITASDANGNVARKTVIMKVRDTTPPSIEAYDWTFDEDKSIMDQLGRPLLLLSDDPTATFTVEGLPPGLEVDPTGVNGIPTTPGVYQVTITATDPSENATTKTVTLTILDKTPPVIEPIDAIVVDEDAAITPIKVSANDLIDLTDVIITVTGMPPGVSFDPVEGEIKGTPTRPGDYTLTVTATDQSGNASSIQVPFTVLDKTAPVITAPDAVIKTGAGITPLQVTTDDPTATISIEADQLPPGLRFDPATGLITGTTDALSGSYDVVITATDPAGNSSTETITITVDDGTGPAIDKLTYTGPAGTRVGIPVVAREDDGVTQVLAGEISVKNLPPGLNYDPKTGQITGTPTTPGSYSASVTAIGADRNSTTVVMPITITDETAPVVNPITDVTVLAGTPITTIVVGSDDPEATYTVTFDPAADGVTFNGADEISGTPLIPGVYEVTVTATDPANNVSEPVTFTITVLDKTKPKIDLIAPVVVDEDAPITAISVDVTGDRDGEQITVKVDNLPDGLRYNSVTGQIEGTPTTPGTSTVTITAVDDAGNQATPVSFDITVRDLTPPMLTVPNDQTVPEDVAITPLQITTDDPPNDVITVTGLPAGLVYSKGEITGTPAEPGEYLVTVTATDKAGNQTAKTFTITVTDLTPPTITPIAPIVTTEDVTMTPITVTTDDPHATIEVTGLPEGVTFTGGQIIGTPTTPGDYTITITATDEAGNSSSIDVPFTVLDGTAPLITPIDDLTVDEKALITPIKVTTDDPADTLTVGGLPPQVSFDPETGEISGVPMRPGVYPITITATDAAGNQATETFTITVVDTTAPVITPISDGMKLIDEPITPIRVTTDDPTATITVTDLPPGLVFDPQTGLITGTPTELGVTEFTVTATDAAGNTSTMTVKITVVEELDSTAPVITPIEAVTVPAGTEISPIKVISDDPTATITVTDLPEGLSYNPETGQIEGTPTTPSGPTTVTITATDAAGNSSSIEVEFTIIEEPDTTGPVISPIEAVTAPAGTGIAPITVNVDDPAAVVEVTGLPDGLSYNAHTGRIEGTPTMPGVYEVTITATDEAGNSSSITVQFTITDETAPKINAADAAVTGGTEISPIAVTTDDPTASVTVTGLPAGLIFDPATGQITGTTDLVGVHEVTITATDPAGNTSTKVIQIIVNDPAGPKIDPIAPVTVEQGQPIETIQITVDDPEATIAVDGLPEGLVFDPGTGQISGTPTAPGEYYVTVTATNAEGKSTTIVVPITVLDVTPPAIGELSDVTVETGSTIAPISITTDDPSATITVTGLPPELFFDPATGQITGTPTKPGVFTITVIATDSAGNSSQVTFTITVADGAVEPPVDPEPVDPDPVDPEPVDPDPVDPKPQPGKSPDKPWGDQGKPGALPKTGTSGLAALWAAIEALFA